MKLTPFIYGAIIVGSALSSAAFAESYSVAILGDPQAWRLLTGDPNSDANKIPWETKNKLVVESLNKLNSTKKIKFGIINGDITEFGRLKTRTSFEQTYKNLPFKYYYGLGNHDYANNVGDCVGSHLTSKDGCAVDMVSRMIFDMESYRHTLKNYNEDIVRNQVSGNFHDYYGSMSYSWDEGAIHYVQMQNFPTYEVGLYAGYWRYHIQNSLKWLEEDLEKATAAGRRIVLNFHDGTDHFIKKSSNYERDHFKSIITSNNVDAIFVGHAHNQFEYKNKNFYGEIPVFVTDALFNGGYYLLDINDGNITVNAYKEEDGQPKFIKTVKEIKNNGPTLTEPKEVCRASEEIYGTGGWIYSKLRFCIKLNDVGKISTKVYVDDTQYYWGAAWHWPKGSYNYHPHLKATVRKNGSVVGNLDTTEGTSSQNSSSFESSYIDYKGKGTYNITFSYTQYGPYWGGDRGMYPNPRSFDIAL